MLNPIHEIGIPFDFDFKKDKIYNNAVRQAHSRLKSAANQRRFQPKTQTQFEIPPKKQNADNARRLLSANKFNQNLAKNRENFRARNVKSGLLTTATEMVSPRFAHVASQKMLSSGSKVSFVVSAP